MAGKDKKKKAPAPVILNWYFMCTAEADVSKLKDALEITDEYVVEIWPEAGVLEVEIDEKSSMDIEECDLDMGDEFSNEFVASVGAKSIFYISYKKDIAKVCEPLMRKLIENIGGRICSDSEDFTPEFR